jgi:glycosyltransferase involved in cell wall biosynthesis
MTDSATQFDDDLAAFETMRDGVLHVITSLQTGGAETQLATLAIANHAAGRRVAVVSLTPGGVHRERLRIAGVPVLDLGLRRGQASPLSVLRLATVIRTMRPSVLQSWMYHADLLSTVAWLLARRWRATRLYWGVRCSDLDMARYGARLVRIVRFCARLSRLPSAVVANSEIGRDVHRRLGYRAKAFPVIDNGIDTDLYRPDPEARATLRADYALDPDTPLIAVVARVDPMKDYLTFIQALDRLPGVHAIAVGERTNELPDTDRLLRFGRRDDVHLLLAGCDVIVSSSAFGEGFSNALAEGMACGLPAVATNVGDAARLIGDCGRTVPPRDPPALADAIQAVLDADPRALGVRARARVVEDFSVARMVDAFNRMHDHGPAALETN